MTNSLPFANHKNEIERQIIVLLVEDILAARYAPTHWQRASAGGEAARL